MFYLTTHSTHFIYDYMASDIWLRTILIVRKETRCRHIGYSYRLTVRVLLYAPSQRQDNTYHSLCYTSHGALAGMRNSSMGPLFITTHFTFCLQLNDIKHMAKDHLNNVRAKSLLPLHGLLLSNKGYFISIILQTAFITLYGTSWNKK